MGRGKRLAFQMKGITWTKRDVESHMFKSRMPDSIENSYKEALGNTVRKGNLGPEIEGCAPTNKGDKLIPIGNSKSLSKDIYSLKRSIVYSGKLGQESESLMRKQFIIRD